jgi:hypothetical protein
MQSMLITQGDWSKEKAKFYKGRSQEKTLPRRPEFFLLRSPIS